MTRSIPSRITSGWFPLSNYDSYAPYIERMTDKGERGLITVYPIIQYAETSGSVGVPKRIPVSDRAMEKQFFYALREE